MKSADQYNNNDIIYVINENNTYKVSKTSGLGFSTLSGKPVEIGNVILLDARPSNFSRDQYKTGDIIYVISEDTTYKAQEKVVWKTDKKEDEEYFLTEAKNVKGTFSVTYKSQTDVVTKPDEKITTTKPVIDGIKQTDAQYQNLKNIIRGQYPEEDLDSAADAIVSTASNFLGQDISDPSIFYTGSGTFGGSGEAFTGSEADFINKVAPGAEDAYKKYKVLPSITLAQAMLESGWGSSDLTKKANNLFGMKAFSDWTGPYVEMLTREENSDGSSYYISAKFRAYNSWNDSIDDHGKLLTGNLYSKVIAASNYTEAANALQEAGYATDHNYANLLIGCIQRYNLDKYDKSN
ncbi:glycoside hydrolase family 73 protein [Clostridium sp. 19966]|nr:glycoside hydrolase family 73 protein [Clostridium sp. 19966]